MEILPNEILTEIITQTLPQSVNIAWTRQYYVYSLVCKWWHDIMIDVLRYADISGIVRYVLLPQWLVLQHLNAPCNASNNYVSRYICDQLVRQEALHDALAYIPQAQVLPNCPNATLLTGHPPLDAFLVPRPQWVLDWYLESGWYIGESGGIPIPMELDMGPAPIICSDICKLFHINGMCAASDEQQRITDPRVVPGAMTTHMSTIDAVQALMRKYPDYIRDPRMYWPNDPRALLLDCVTPALVAHYMSKSSDALKYLAQSAYLTSDLLNKLLPLWPKDLWPDHIPSGWARASLAPKNVPVVIESYPLKARIRGPVERFTDAAARQYIMYICGTGHTAFGQPSARYDEHIEMITHNNNLDWECICELEANTTHKATATLCTQTIIPPAREYALATIYSLNAMIIVDPARRIQYRDRRIALVRALHTYRAWYEHVMRK